MFGCSPAQVVEASGVLRTLASEWRTLVAGSEGFLTGGRRGLEGQQVVWGEMDSFVGVPLLSGLVQLVLVLHTPQVSGCSCERDLSGA